MAVLQRTIGMAWPLLLVAVIVLPVLPKAWSGGLGAALGRNLRVISVGHRWVMYAHPSRTERRIRVEAEWGDGRRIEVPLPRSEGGWDRDRRVLWEAMVSKGRPSNRNLRWFLRGQCVRAESLGHGTPRSVILIRRVRRVRSPDQVRRGRSVWGPWREKVVTKEPCPRPPSST